MTSAERAVLLACARAHLEAEGAAGLRALVGHVRDWSALLELGRRHRLLPLLHTHLSAAADDLVPPHERAVLRSEFAGNAAKNLALTLELVGVIELLESARLPAVPYKGPALAHCVYGSLASRPMKDLDILVPRRDFDRAVSLLAQRGYQPATRALRAAHQLGLEHQCVLVREADEAIIELHWTIVPRAMAPAITVEELWPSLVRTAILGRPISMPSHEDMLVMLCVHGAKHGWSRLEWICGVAELLRSKPLDWLTVLTRAGRWHATRMLSTGLLLAKDLLDAPVPHPVLAAAREDGEATALASSVREGLFADAHPTPQRSDARAFHLRVQDGLRDRARYRWFRPLIDAARRGARFAELLGTAAAQ